MTAHRHVRGCYADSGLLSTGGVWDLVCDRPGWSREHLELHVPEDELVDRYAGDLEPHRSCLVIGCGSIVIALLIVGALLAWLSGAIATPRPAADVIPAIAQGQAGPTAGATSGNLPRLTGAPLTASESSSETTGDAPSSRIRGLATWYCGSGSACTAGHSPGELVAAIDPGVGFRRGERIRVTAGDRSVVVRIVDVCACSGDRIVDLSWAAFARLADPARGVIAVTVERLEATPTLPPTDTAP